MLFCEVIPFRKVGSLSRLTYCVPVLYERVQAGDIVEIPIREKREQGIVSSVFRENGNEEKYKNIGRILFSQLYTEVQITAFQNISEYFFFHEGWCYEKGIPKFLQKIHYQPLTLNYICCSDLVQCDQLSTLRGEKQKSLLKLLLDSGESLLESDIKKRFSSSVIQSLEEKKMIKIFSRPKYSQVKKGGEKATNFSECLHIGSVYSERFLKDCDWIASCKKNDGQVLVLFPDEISLLSAQKKYQNTFSEIDVWTSSLGKKEENDLFWKIQTGNARVVFGTRNALFLPFKNLQGVMLFEYSHYSYTSLFHPFLNTGYAAKIVAKSMGIPFLQTSVSGDINQFYRCNEDKEGKVTFFSSLKTPKQNIVDMKEDFLDGNFSPVSQSVIAKISDRIQKNQLSVLYLNRKGLHTSIVCKSCGWTPVSPFSGQRMTVFEYQGKKVLRCSGSKHSQYFPSSCPNCSGEIQSVGEGTQYVEKVIQSKFPGANILRIDGDTPLSFVQAKKLFMDIENGDVDVIIGTQLTLSLGMMDRCTLAVDVLSDNSFTFPSFSSEERSWNQSHLLKELLSAGNNSELVFQTTIPDHPTVQHWVKDNFSDWYISETNVRKSLLYPPFADVFSVFMVGKSEKSLIPKINTFLEGNKKNILKSLPIEITILPHQNKKQAEKVIMVPVGTVLQPEGGIRLKRIL